MRRFRAAIGRAALGALAFSTGLAGTAGSGGSGVFPASARAAEAPAVERLTWEQCLAEASRSNAELLSARESLAAAEARTRGARSGYFPEVSGSLGYARGATSPSANARAIPADSYTATLNASQSLFAGFRTQAQVAQASADEAIARAALETARAKVSYDLKAAFEGLAYARSAQALAREIARRREDNLRLVELRFQSGRENKGSELLSRAYLAQARLDELTATHSIRVASQELARVLGRDEPDPDTELDVAGEAPTRDPGEKPDFRKLAAATPSHLQAVARTDSAEAGLTAARSAFFPSLDLTGQLGRVGTTFFPERDRWSVGVAITLPLFNGGRDYYGARAASEALLAAAHNQAAIDRDLLARLSQAYATFVEAVERVKVDEAFYEAARTRARIAREKYNNGLLSFEDWDIIENDLISRERNRLQSRRDRVVNEAAWEQALGRGVVP